MVTPEDLDAEAERLEADYYRHWMQYEGFNLKEAFKSQNLRVDRDWQQHEKALAEDYRTRRSKIVPSESHSHNHSANHAAVEAPDPRWHSAEKQKRLIHTAPVLAPSKHSQPLNHSGDATHHTGGSRTTAELDKLEREYAASMRSLEKQKADARRWLNRQQVRLMAQAEETQKEKALVADLMDSQSIYFKQLLEVLDQAKSHTISRQEH
mmetsp:Transcript_11188/g.16852  ORF Transcript_11188/g.16852 Transcript_11188/m.16852 type:complete len:209 (-) Transcript_11188:92-718(-)